MAPVSNSRKHGLAVEEHLPLVGEVAKEGALGHPGPRGDLGGRGLVVAALAEQLDGGLLQASARWFSVAGHLFNLSDLTVTVIMF